MRWMVSGVLSVLSLAPLFADAVLPARREVAKIRALPLVKREKQVAGNNDAVFPAPVTLYLDAGGCCRRVIFRYSGVNHGSSWVGYYDATGRMVMAVFSESWITTAAHTFQGVVLFSGGQPVQYATVRIDQYGDGRPPGIRKDLRPRIEGQPGGEGLRLHIFPTPAGLFKHLQYPRGFVTRGTWRSTLPEEPSAASVTGEGVRVRAVPSLNGRVLGSPDPGETVTVIGTGPKEMSGGFISNWMHIAFRDRKQGGKTIEGWIFGIYLDME